MESVEFSLITKCDMAAFGALEERDQERRCWDLAAGMLDNVATAPTKFVLGFIDQIGHIAIKADVRATGGDWRAVTPDRLLTPVVALARPVALRDRARALALVRIVVTAGARDMPVLNEAEMSAVRTLVGLGRGR